MTVWLHLIVLIILSYNCVDHTILLLILQIQFGIYASALLRINSFLSSRTHNVRFVVIFSRMSNLIFGVPQSSTLDPLVFILHSSTLESPILHYIGSRTFLPGLFSLRKMQIALLK